VGPTPLRFAQSIHFVGVKSGLDLQSIDSKGLGGDQWWGNVLR
jgi:hypothetical protein